MVKQLRLYSNDIECDSCVKVLDRTLGKMNGITGLKVTNSYIDVSYENKVKKKDIISLITEKGYKVSENPIHRPKIRERAKEFLTNRQKYAVEWRMLRYVAIVFLMAVLIQVGILAMINSSTGTALKYFPWFSYLTVSVVALAGALWHFKAYRTNVTCMTGMMIGMTIGMQTGMMIGAVIGVTNGFFWGATIGMLLGSMVGMFAGKCCGIMGAMEGLMSGIMGGTMGAMITFMMFNDNIQYFMPIYLVLNLAVLAGFSYMLFEELVEGKDVLINPVSFPKFAITTLGVQILLFGLVLYLPASIFFG